MEKFIPDPARLQAVEENWKRVLDRRAPSKAAAIPERFA